MSHKHKSHHEPETKNSNENSSEADLTTLPYDELVQKLTENEQKSAQLWERVMRMQADSDNAARRAERDLANAHKYALEKFTSELLPIVDSLELCILTAPADNKPAQAVAEGVDLTLKMFYSALDKFGIKQINPLNEPFDPEFQQAISMQYDPAVKPGMVISVLQKGYTLNNRLVRPALVVVSKSEE